MGIFEFLFGSPSESLSEYEPSTIAKAEAIAKNLGKITLYGTGKGSGYNIYEYTGHNLHIIYYTGFNSTTKISFGGRRVAGDGKYVSGAWEELVDELYDSIYETKKRRRKEERMKERKEDMLQNLKAYDHDITFSDTVRAEIIKYPYSDYGTSCREIYRVYASRGNVERLVFHADNNAIKTFIPGPWESVIEQYIIDEEENRIQREEEEARKTVKMLRRKRLNRRNS